MAGPGPARLREATPTDLAAVAGVHAMSRRSAYASFLPDRAVERLGAESTALWRERLDPAADGVVLVAEDDLQALIGFGMISPTSEHWSTVNALHLRPDVRGRGVGRQLLAALLERSLAWRRTSARLYVLAANAGPRGFYEHLGWQLRGAGPPRSVGGHQVETVRYDLHIDKSVEAPR